MVFDGHSDLLYDVTRRRLAGEKRVLERRHLRNLEAGGVEGLTLYTDHCRNQSGVLSLRSARMNCEEMASLLGEKGVCVRAGLHCAPYAHRTAGTLDSGTVRFSFSPFNCLEDVSLCCRFIKDLL